jgi:type I restriction enzyme S subunit
MPRDASPIKALKGRKAIAQGNTLGSLANNALSPEGAEQGELPEGWARLTVGEVASNSCASRAMETASSAARPFIPMALLPQDGSVTAQWEMRKPEEVRSGIPFTDGDVLLAKITPCLENGKLGIARDVPGGWGMTSTEVYPLRPVKVTAEFLAAFLTQPAIRHALASKMQGATGRQRLPREALDSFPIIAPPLPEQRAIAEVLRTVQRAKEATEKVIAATRQLKASLMKHLFTYGPVPFAQADRVPAKELETGPIPRHWTICRLGELADVKGGKRLPKGSSFADSPTPHPYIRVVDFENWSVNTGDLRFLRDEDHRAIARYIIRCEDVYISIAGTIGLVGTVLQELDGANLTENAARLVIKHQGLLLRDYLVCYLASAGGQTEIFARTMKTSQPKLALARIKDIPVHLPPLFEQDQIAQQISAVDAKLAAVESRRAGLAALFQSLLHHLMTGKVRLPEFAETG